MRFLDSLFRRQLVGLDIGVSGIKAVELRTGKNPRLVAYNRIPLPWNTISLDGEIKEREVLVNALKKLFHQGVFKSKQVAVGAFGKTLITKKITVPQMTHAELEHQMYWEAEQYIPFNINEVNLDFAILGPHAGSQVSQEPLMDVLLVAAKKDFVATLRSLLEEANLDLEVIDSQAFALGNVFEFNSPPLSELGPSRTSVLIDLGAGTTKISVVEGDKTTFTRELAQSGTLCSQMIAEAAGISLEEAEQLKIEHSKDVLVLEAIERFTETLVEEISRSVDFFLSQGMDRSLQSVYICGGGAKLKGLAEAMSERLAIPVETLNPIQSISGAGQKMSPAVMTEIAHLGAVAVGLGLRKAGDT